jgi:dienelactone hydrolase
LKIRRIWTAVAFVVVALAHDYGDIRNLNQSNGGTHYPAPAFGSLKDWTASRARIRQQILSAAGLEPMLAKTPLNVRREVVLTRPHYVVERVALEVFPGYHLAGNLYSPARKRSGRAAVLIPQGHWKGGRVEHGPDYSTPTFGANLAALGFVAFAYDMVGYNELDALPHVFGKTPIEQLWSFSPLGLQLWCGIRALDFVTGLPEVDPRRVAVTGASGGATQTLLLAAVDDRVAASAPVVMVSSDFQGDDSCEMAPGLRVGSNNVEIAAVFAPKPQLLVSAARDWTKHTPEREFPGVRSVYRLYGREAMVSFDHFEARHNFNRQSREAVTKFLHRHLHRRSAPPLGEMEVFDAPPESLLHHSNPKRDPAELEALFTRWRAFTATQMNQLTPAERLGIVGRATGLVWPAEVQVLKAGRVNLLGRDGNGERVPFIWLQGADEQPVLVVHPNGSAAARRDPETREWLDGTRAALLVDVYQTGEASTPRAPLRADHLTYHRSDDANRVQDILTALAFLHRGGGEPVRMVCPGHANGWCALAAALAPIRVDFTPSPATMAASEEDIQRNLFIPGLLRAGGVQAIRQVAQQRSGSTGTSAVQ